jgi:hypothetical protein
MPDVAAVDGQKSHLPATPHDVLTIGHSPGLGRSWERGDIFLRNLDLLRSAARWPVELTTS